MNDDTPQAPPTPWPGDNDDTTAVGADVVPLPDASVPDSAEEAAREHALRAGLAEYDLG